jgi:hypothetical protein
VKGDAEEKKSKVEHNSLFPNRFETNIEHLFNEDGLSFAEKPIFI